MKQKELITISMLAIIALASTISATENYVFSTFLKNHNVSGDCWIIIYDKVYNMTPMNSTGQNIFICGADNSALYNMAHGLNTDILNKYYLGEVVVFDTRQSNASEGLQNISNPNNATDNRSNTNTGNAPYPANASVNNTPAPVPPASPSQPQSGCTASSCSFTESEVGSHDTKDDCWVIVYGKVYDITSLTRSHTGGNVFQCGSDNTAAYSSAHGTSVGRMESYLKGILAGATLQDDTPEIEEIRESNEELEIKVGNLTRTISSDKKQISELELQIEVLQTKLDILAQEVDATKAQKAQPTLVLSNSAGTEVRELMKSIEAMKAPATADRGFFYNLLKWIGLIRS